MNFNFTIMGAFLENLVNQRFRQVYKALEEQHKIKGKSDIAKQLGTYNHVINSILKGKRNITVDQLNKLFEIYHINANFIFGSSEQIFTEAGMDADSIEDDALEGRNNITLVPQVAMAGYAIEFNNPTYTESLQQFSIPGLDGQLIAFEISGDSMSPTITNGDLVVCEPVERGEPLRDNAVYVIVTDVVVAKRIQQIKQDNHVSELQLISDNSLMYKPYTVDVNEIRQILKVKSRLTVYGIN